MSWFWFALSSAFFSALSRTFARLYLKKEGHPLAFTAWHNVIAGLCLIPLWLWQFQWPQYHLTWLWIGGIVSLIFLLDWFTFWALKEIPVATFMIISSLRHVFALVGGVLFFQEAFLWAKVFAILFILAGVMFSLYEKARFQFSIGIMLVVINSFLTVILYFLIKQALKDINEITLASMELLISGLLSALVLLFLGKKSLLKTEWIMNRSGLIKAAIAFAFFDLFFFMALGSGEVSKVTPVTQASLIFTLFFGAVFLKERQYLWHKIIGSCLVMTGIILINQA